jgi:hypothetical protein
VDALIGGVGLGEADKPLIGVGLGGADPLTGGVVLVGLGVGAIEGVRAGD